MSYDADTVCLCAVHHWRDCDKIVDGLEVHNTLISNRSWNSWVGTESISLGKYRVEVVASKIEEDPGRAHWGEGTQGWQGAAQITFKVETADGDLKFFRKDGSVDSYSRVSWDGVFRIVVPKTKEVKVYEYE